MKPIPRDTTTHPGTDSEQPARERDDERERDDRPDGERQRRIGATQLAAPSTRRWRRAGRFDPAS
jgi:hypothetical protein